MIKLITDDEKDAVSTMEALELLMPGGIGGMNKEKSPADDKKHSSKKNKSNSRRSRSHSPRRKESSSKRYFKQKSPPNGFCMIYFHFSFCLNDLGRF